MMIVINAVNNRCQQKVRNLEFLKEKRIPKVLQNRSNRIVTTAEKVEGHPEVPTEVNGIEILMDEESKYFGLNLYRYVLDVLQ